jgi:TRAP-type C4-dicarboxylate transport system substrate-binding protein
VLSVSKINLKEDEMKKLMLFTGMLVVMLLGSAIISVCTRPVWAQTPTRFNWKFNTVLPMALYNVPYENEFCKEVTERSGGRLTITFHPAGELGYKGPEILRLLRSGVLDISGTARGYVAGDLPIIVGTEMPGLSVTFEEAKKVRDAAAPFIEQEQEKKFGVMTLMVIPYDSQHFQANKRLEKLEDFKGLKFRVSVATYAKVLAAIGAVPVPMPLGEIYASAQRGLIDACANSFTGAVAVKSWELWKYFCKWYYVGPPPAAATLVRKQSFDALPKDIQRIVFDTARKWQEKAWADAPAAVTQIEASLVQKGMVMVEVSEQERARLAAKAVGVWADFIKAAGTPGREMVIAMLKATGREEQSAQLEEVLKEKGL